MERPVDVFEFLEWLRKQNGKKTQNFSSLGRYLGFKAREKGVPIQGQFELTPLCNFSCKMCYVHLNPDQLQGQSVLSVEIWKDLMHQAWEAGMCTATLTGGECLTYPGFDELFLYLHSLGCEVEVLTNGFLLNDERIEFFTKHKPSRIQVTLYGQNDDVYERVTGQRAFSTVDRNIRKVIDAGLPLNIAITPSTFLGDDVLETIRYTKQYSLPVSVNYAIFSPREETGRSEQRDNPEKEMCVRIYRLLNELNGQDTKEIEESKLPPYGSEMHECAECGLRCGGGRSGFVMDWKGTLMPCNRLSVIRGDALQEGFKAAWQKINQEANRWPRVPECKECAYQSICENCAANVFRYTEPGKQPIELCELTKYYVQHGVKIIPDCE